MYFSWDALECGSLYYSGSFHWVAVVTPTLQWCCFFFYWDALESGSPFLPPVYPLGYSCYSHSQVVLFLTGMPTVGLPIILLHRFFVFFP